MAQIFFYCDPVIGDNRNSGSNQNASPFYSTTSGNWNQATNVFTPTDGSNPATMGVAIGTYFSVFNNTATDAGWISRVTAVVNATNGAVTLSAFGAGSSPSTSSGNMSARAGGAWKGPNGTSGFPFTLARLGQLVPDSGGVSVNTTMVLFSNIATYNITAGISVTNPQPVPVIFQVFNPTGLPNLATIDSGTLSATAFSVNTGSLMFVGLQFQSSATVGTSALVSDVTGGNLWRSCVFTGARGSGLFITGGSSVCIDCAAWNCNRSNLLGQAGFNLSTNSKALRCISYNHPGSNGVGFSGTCASFVECIATGCGSHGISQGGVGTWVKVKNCDFYNNGGAGIGQVAGQYIIENCNFVKNLGGAVYLPNTSTVGNWPQGVMFNCAYGSGTMANGADALGNIGVYNLVTYPPNTTPWNNPDIGDFRLISPLATNAGYGWHQNYDFNGNPLKILGYPDIGAVQASVTIGGGGGGGDGGDGAEALGGPNVVELPRPTIKVRDPELASVLRRARRASRIVEDMTIVGAAGSSEDGFSLGD